MRSPPEDTGDFGPVSSDGGLKKKTSCVPVSCTVSFALYDMDRNSLTFYRDLKSAENEHTTA